MKTALSLTDKREYKFHPLKINTEDNSNENLLFFENEMHLDFKDLKKYKNIYFVLLSNDNRKLKLGQKVLDYKSKIINDHKKKI